MFPCIDWFWKGERFFLSWFSSSGTTWWTWWPRTTGDARRDGEHTLPDPLKTKQTSIQCVKGKMEGKSLQCGAQSRGKTCISITRCSRSWFLLHYVIFILLLSVLPYLVSLETYCKVLCVWMMFGCTLCSNIAAGAECVWLQGVCASACDSLWCNRSLIEKNSDESVFIANLRGSIFFVNLITLIQSQIL